MAGFGADDMEVRQSDPLLVADHRPVIEAAGGGGHAGMAAGKVENVVPQGGGRKSHRLAGDDGAGAREGAGVVGCQISVGVDDGDAIRTRTEDRGRDLPVR